MILAFTLLGASESARAAVIIEVYETGGDVVFATTGNLNLRGATALSGINYDDGFIPGGSNWYVASGTGSSVDNYALTAFDGPFGTSETFFSTPNSVSGSDFFIWGQGGQTPQVGVPNGYVSGDPIDSTMVFTGATIAGFTMIPGSYVYSLPNDTITLNIRGDVIVPEPGAFSLLAVGLAVGLAMRLRRRSQA